MKECGAKTRAGTPCRRAAMPNGRCSKHGGKSPGGKIKHGRYSKKWANQLAAKMEAAEGDVRLFNQQKRTAFLHALWEEAVQEMLTLSDDSPAQMWSLAGKVFANLRKQLQPVIDSLGAKEIDKGLKNLEAILENGQGVQRAEQKAIALVAQIAEVSRVQYQGMKTSAEIVSAQELDLFRARVIAEIRAIDDERIRQSDALGIKRLMAEVLLRAAGGAGS